ncbi:NAD(+) diphosphatase [Clostridium folliculivorans]|uniref:NAD(+) diphosphatase n=1 Tax=Clostridium folliculivorans TaxID=2886038 RepID=A0A9W5Y387_9CLOT|nr:NAD(+) diphosphatase [Clostridium folliculivorans]GKU25747.1 NADH pyrophosphatase [Clostridium folliculivorans]GKU28769.1 NADH pyrophosphatase [Clostridium folliculivorans]
MEQYFKILSDVTKKIIDDDFVFVFYNGNILVKIEQNSIKIPLLKEIKPINIKYEDQFFIGEIAEISCFATETHSEIKLSEGFELMSLRDFANTVNECLFSAAGRANQILHWNRTNKFCGKCGAKTVTKEDEIAKVCPKCDHVMYPVICPAIIVAVIKGDQILLAHNSNFKNNMYSLIAGFVEAGEDLESAVKREVLEEVGIKVKNVRYHNSAPWSFPNSLMLGFIAEYESGDIKVDGKEILYADWFDKDHFPNIPEKFTLARKIIDGVIYKD